MFDNLINLIQNICKSLRTGKQSVMNTPSQQSQSSTPQQRPIEEVYNLIPII